MSVLHVIFWLFSCALIASSLWAICARQTVHAVLSLIVAFFSSAVIWLILQAEFLGLVLLFVYIGAVMTLFLFVVMMLNLSPGIDRHRIKFAALAVAMVVVIVALMMFVTDPEHFVLSGKPMALKDADYNNTAALGAVLYTKYVYPFQLTGILLLTAIMAAVALVHRRPQHTKSQQVSAQVAVDPSQRIKLIKMKSEPK
jgi:NADH-quinone oxidoreductase subunit J